MINNCLDTSFKQALYKFYQIVKQQTKDNFSIIQAIKQDYKQILNTQQITKSTCKHCSNEFSTAGKIGEHTMHCKMNKTKKIKKLTNKKRNNR